MSFSALPSEETAETLPARSPRSVRRLQWGGLATLLIGGFAAAGFLCSVVYLHLFPPPYVAMMTVMPAAPVTNNFTPPESLSSLAGGLFQHTTEITPFDQLKAVLYTRDLAERLERKYGLLKEIYAARWNATTGTWRPPSRLIALRDGIIGIFSGQRVASGDPSPSQLALRLRSSLKIVPDQDNGATELEFSYRDPEHAKEILSRVIQEADDIVRESAIRESDAMAEFLNQRLRSIQNLEHARALTQLLVEREQTSILAHSTLPYSVRIVDQPWVSPSERLTRIVMLLLLGPLVGGALGALVLVVMRQRDALWRR